MHFLFLARSVSEGDHESSGAKTNVRSGNDRELKMSRLFGSQEAIVVPLADASG